MRVSIETLYRWIYQEAAKGGQLYQCLHRGHKKRRRQHRYGAGRGLIPGRVSIHVRPDIVANRLRYGDWEGDTVEGAKGTAYITTHVERKSRYLIAGKLINKTAAVTAAMASAAHVTTLELVNQRLSPNAMEPRSAIGHYDEGMDNYTLWTTSQNPHLTRLLLCAFVLGLPEHKVRVVAPDVGGGFGSKIFHYTEEALVIWASNQIKRPVKWT